MEALTAEIKPLHTRVLSGSFVLLTASGMVTGISFLYNMAVARFLGASAFGHVSAVYTALILISAVTLSFQILTTKLVAQRSTEEARISAYRFLHQKALMAGASVAVVLLLFARQISGYLNLPNSSLIIWLAIAVAFYIPLGARRGYLQGTCDFRRFATNVVLEGLCRLFVTLAAIYLGWGVSGVIAAIAAAVAAAYVFALPKLQAISSSEANIPHAFGEALQAIVFFIGQVVINNCDIVLVKHFFPPVTAGLYAAVALIGRVIFASSWAVINSMFPISAGATSQERQKHNVLGTTLLLVLGIGSFLSVCLRFAPAWVWTMLFGPQFELSGKYGFPYLLAFYAVTACVYALCVVLIAYEMSHRIANIAWVQLLFGAAVIAGICRYHASLQQVILVQFVLMIVLFGFVAIPFLLAAWARWRTNGSPLDRIPLRMIRKINEDEVIAEFLKSDFHSSPEFADYQEMKALVTAPDLNNAADNIRRRALLFLRHGSLWRELPKDTEWFEVVVRGDDLERIQVFPRAQWRKLARGNFAIGDVLQSLGAGKGREISDAFEAKISDLRRCLAEDKEIGSVLLIGLDETSPLTILDGNHRLVAASLNRPQSMHRLRFLCGLSPNMAKCCWYKTNLATLTRYGANMLRDVVHDPEADIVRLLQSS